MIATLLDGSKKEFSPCSSITGTRFKEVTLTLHDVKTPNFQAWLMICILPRICNH